MVESRGWWETRVREVKGWLGLRDGGGQGQGVGDGQSWSQGVWW